MSTKQGLKKWEDLFPLDSWWRKKYKVAFGSKQHLEITQLAIYYDWLSDQINREFFEEMKLIDDKKEKLVLSILTDRSPQKEMTDREFDDLDLSKLE